MASIISGSEGIAARYALALFELADEAKTLDAVADDLRTIKQLISDSDDFARLVASPMVSRSAQAAAADQVLQSVQIGDLVRRFVGVVAQNRRLFVLGAMADTYLSELARRRGEVTASVTAAHALTDEQVAALTDQLRHSLGAKVTVDLTVDPALLGGMVVKVGSRMIDSSLKTKLSKLQLALKTA